MFKKLVGTVMVVCLSAGIACAEGKGKNPLVLMETSELFEKEAPESVRNFLTYVNKGFYSGTIFHRVIKNFMIQGGGFTPSLVQKPTLEPIRNEADNGLKNDRGTIAMARTGMPDSATSQFFINVVNNRMLNRPDPDGFGYAVFGRVVSGMDVVDRIRGVKTGFSRGMGDVPEQPVLIRSVKVLN